MSSVWARGEIVFHELFQEGAAAKLNSNKRKLIILNNGMIRLAIRLLCPELIALSVANEETNDAN